MKLHFREIGEGEPVFIFHGLFGMNDNWQTFGKNLSERGYKVILADLRNHGHSPHAAEHSYEKMADDIFELINDTGNNNPVVVGHSMGGKAVLKLLDKYPGSVTKAVVIDIGPWTYPVLHMEVLNALNSIKPSELNNRKEAEDQLKETLNDNGTIQFLLKNLYRIDTDNFAWRFNLDSLTNNIEKIGEAVFPEKKVETPVKFIRGELSNYLDFEKTEEITDYFPLAEFETIQHAGHWVHVDQPAALMSSILEFIRQ